MDEHVCGRCGKLFSSIKDFLDHKKFPCKTFSAEDVQSKSSGDLETEMQDVSQLQFPLRCPHCPNLKVYLYTESSYEEHCLASHIGDSTIFEGDIKTSIEPEKTEGNIDVMKKRKKLIEDFKDHLALCEDPLAFLLNQAKRGNCSPLEGATERFLYSYTNDPTNIGIFGSILINWITEQTNGEVNLEMDKLCPKLNHNPVEKNEDATRDQPETEQNVRPLTTVSSSTKKLTRNPGLLAFNLWANQQRKQLRQENPGLPNNEISKIVGMRWKALSGSDKARYVEEVDRTLEADVIDQHKTDTEWAHDQPENANWETELVVSPITKVSSPTKKLKQNPATAYNLWANQQRKQLRQENPGLPNKEISKILGMQWKTLSGPDKARYVEEVERTLQAGVIDQHETDTEWAHDQPETPNWETELVGSPITKVSSSTKLLKQNNATAYNLWANQQRKQLRQENPGLPNNEISKMLGMQWRALSGSQKTLYVEEVTEEEPVAPKLVDASVDQHETNTKHKWKPQRKKRATKDILPQTALSSYEPKTGTTNEGPKEITADTNKVAKWVETNINHLDPYRPSYNFMVKEAVMAVRARKKGSHAGVSKEAVIDYIVSKFKVGKDSGIINSQVRQTLGHLVAKGVLTQTTNKGTFKMVKLLSRMKMRKQRILELLARGIKVPKIAKIVGCTYDTARRTAKDKKDGEDLDCNDEVSSGANSDSDEEDMLDEADPLAGTNEKDMTVLNSHASYISMVIKAIKTLRKEKKWKIGGVSWQAITHFITSNYQVKDDFKSVKNQVKQTLRKYVARGKLVHNQFGSRGYKVATKKSKMSKPQDRTLHTPGLLDKGTKMTEGISAPRVTSASISNEEIPQICGAHPATVDEQTTSHSQVFTNMKLKEESLIEESDSDFHQRHNMNILDLLEDNDDDDDSNFIESM